MLYSIVRVILTALMVITFCTTTYADAEERLPKVIVSGFDDFKTFGSRKAVQAWLKNGPHENSSYSINFYDILTKTEEAYGEFKKYELIKKFTWTNSTVAYFLTINYEKGPLFVKFMLFLSRGDWIIYAIDMNTNPEAILTEVYLTGLRPQ